MARTKIGLIQSNKIELEITFYFYRSNRSLPERATSNISNCYQLHQEELASLQVNRGYVRYGWGILSPKITQWWNIHKERTRDNDLVRMRADVWCMGARRWYQGCARGVSLNVLKDDVSRKLKSTFAFFGWSCERSARDQQCECCPSSGVDSYLNLYWFPSKNRLWGERAREDQGDCFSSFS